MHPARIRTLFLLLRWRLSCAVSMRFFPMESDWFLVVFARPCPEGNSYALSALIVLVQLRWKYGGLITKLLGSDTSLQVVKP